VISHLAGVGTAWLNVEIAFVIYALTPLFFIVPPQFQKVPAGQKENVP
jgi:hypothetical protein